jgi:uncharacterized membrane protein YdjX (TVP38/TMEM64 family)
MAERPGHAGAPARRHDPADGTVGRKGEPRSVPRALPWRFLPIAVIVLGLAAAYALGWQRYLTLDYLAGSRNSLKDFVAASPVLAALGFAGLYALAVALSVPAASVLTVFGGFLFGWLQAGILVAVAATIGATALFIAARSAFGDFLRDHVRGRAARLAEGFERDAFGYLLVLRLAPVFPFFVVNIAPALFDVRPRTYVAATFIGILPGTFAYAYLGTSIDSVLDAAHRAGRPVALADLVSPQLTIAFTLLALVAAIPTVIRAVRARRHA